jgi:hypothetical protein
VLFNFSKLAHIEVSNTIICISIYLQIAAQEVGLIAPYFVLLADVIAAQMIIFANLVKLILIWEEQHMTYSIVGHAK